MRHAKETQLKHWSTIAEATFDDIYVQSVTRIGRTDNRLGLETPLVHRRLQHDRYWDAAGN